MDRHDAALAVRFLEATRDDERTPALREQRQIAGAVVFVYGRQQVLRYQEQQQAVGAAEMIARSGQPEAKP